MQLQERGWEQQQEEYGEQGAMVFTISLEQQQGLELGERTKVPQTLGSTATSSRADSLVVDSSRSAPRHDSLTREPNDLTVHAYGVHVSVKLSSHLNEPPAVASSVKEKDLLETGWV